VRTVHVGERGALVHVVLCGCCGHAVVRTLLTILSGGEFKLKLCGRVSMLT